MKGLIVFVLLLGCASGYAADAPMDVPKGHWAYEAVKELADAGLVLGYPDGSFLGSRSLTRYEFATIVKRVVDNVGQETMAMKNGFASSATAAIATTTAPAVEVTKEQIEAINKLVDEFKVELAVIGTRLDKVEATVEELNSKLANIDAIVSDPGGALETAKSDIGKLKKVTVSGYLQTRYQNFDYAAEDVPAKDAFDTFLIKRARAKFTAKPTDRSTAVLQLDMGQNSVSVKDTYLQYALGCNSSAAPSFWVGQFQWPFGYEVVYSSSRRETPEQALVFRRLFPGEYDQGAKLMGAESARFKWNLGCFNGTGTQKNSFSDLNNAKDIVANAKWSLGAFDLGFSGYYGLGAWKKFGDPLTYETDVRKIRFGADLQVYLNNLTLKAEYVRGKGVDAADSSWDQNQYVDGYYAQLNYSVTSKDTLVGRYSSMSQDPVKPQYGRRNATELGYLRWLDSSSRLKFFYKWNTEQYEQFYNDGFATEWVVTY